MSSTDYHPGTGSDSEMKALCELNTLAANVDAETQHGQKELEGRSGGSPPWMKDIPDGGLDAWLVILGNWCTSFVTFGWINSIGIFQDYYQYSLFRGYSASTIAWIPSLQIFFMMAMGPVVGMMFDRYGPRWLLVGGAVLHVFGLMMASISTDYYQVFLAQGVCSAIGVAAIFQSALNCIGGWFLKKRGMAFGLAATGASVGGVVFPIMVNRLIDEIDYGWAMRISAFLILVLLVVGLLTVKTRVPPSPKAAPKGQLLKPTTEVGFVALLLGIFFFTFGYFTPVTYITVLAIEDGMSPDLARYLIAILNAGSLLGRLASGMIADNIGKYNTFIIACYLTSILNLALWIPATGTGPIVAFAVLFGVTSGAYVSLIAALVVQVSPLPEIGVRTGLVFLLASVGGLTAGPISGRILATSHGVEGLKVFSGVLCLVGSTFVLVARIKFAGFKLATVF